MITERILLEKVDFGEATLIEKVRDIGEATRSFREGAISERLLLEKA